MSIWNVYFEMDFYVFASDLPDFGGDNHQQEKNVRKWKSQSKVSGFNCAESYATMFIEAHSF